MLQPILKIVLVLTSLFMVIILAFRLLPNDDAAISTLLFPPDGCPAPCFMNIRAGETDSIEAARLIDKHIWVKSPPFFMRSLDDMYTRYVLWQWSGQQPSGIDTRRQGKLQIYKDRAVAVVIPTTLSLGAVRLVLGSTDKGTLSLTAAQPDTDRLLVMVYPAEGLLVRTIVPRHVSQRVLWTSMTEIESSNPQLIAYFGGYHLPVLTRLWGIG